jgi:hypothetical protein
MYFKYYLYDITNGLLYIKKSGEVIRQILIF